MQKIVIYVKGGMVQDVYSSVADTEVTVVDYDVPEEERQEAEQPDFHVY